jgi:hypothetical protein
MKIAGTVAAAATNPIFLVRLCVYPIYKHRVILLRPIIAASKQEALDASLRIVRAVPRGLYVGYFAIAFLYFMKDDPRNSGKYILKAHLNTLKKFLTTSA